jgi:hypothetical protein
MGSSAKGGRNAGRNRGRRQGCPTVEYSFSVAPCELAKPDRMALECYLIWLHRLAARQSPRCNFERMHPHYIKSRNRSTGKQGSRLPEGETNSAVGPHLPPLRATADPCDSGWMGLHWEGPMQFKNETIDHAPNCSGLYKIHACGDVAYIGETVNLRARLRTHRRSSWGDSVAFAFVPLPDVRFKCQRLEAENDLVAAFYEARQRAPLKQFVA